jgi:predicted nucleic acid-binding Zn ribbon protein
MQKTNRKRRVPITSPKRDRVDELLRVFSRISGVDVEHGLLSSIAKEAGCSREYVRQRAELFGFTSDRDRALRIRENRICVYCGKKYVGKPNQSFCSKKCRDTFHFYKYWELRICEVCGSGYVKMRSLTNTPSKNSVYPGGGGERFCSNTCKGKFLGKNYGWGSPRDYRRKHASTVEGLRSDLGTESFTIIKFCEFYNYKTPATAYRAIRHLLEIKAIKRVPTITNFHLYKVA